MSIWNECNEEYERSRRCCCCEPSVIYVSTDESKSLKKQLKEQENIIRQLKRELEEKKKTLRSREKHIHHVHNLNKRLQQLLKDRGIEFSPDSPNEQL